jgi:hypothetical protein
MSVAELEAGLRELAGRLYSAEFTDERRENYRRRLRDVMHST